jgi:hypothetical protein
MQMHNGTIVGAVGITRAFNLGRKAELEDKTKSINPYRPSEADGVLFEAWNLGFAYEEIRYSIAETPFAGDDNAN